MAAETITVYIDSSQLQAQKNNNYSLFLAKMVNGSFTVIWQSRGPVATVTNPTTYEYNNVFEIAVPSYQVNYATTPVTSGSVTDSASGLAAVIDLGQEVILDKNGLFGKPTNTGTPGEITILNALSGNPQAMLLDDQGNAIFADTQSGMDIGTTTLTPIDTYQIWFDNIQDSGTIIAQNVSSAATVTFSGGSTTQVISYDAQGQWQNGPLQTSFELPAPTDASSDDDLVSVTVLATFTTALSLVAVTYLLSKLIDKFSPNLKPKKITAKVGGQELSLEFENPQTRRMLARFGTDKYESAVNSALQTCKKDPASGLKDETWSLREPALAVSY